MKKSPPLNKNHAIIDTIPVNARSQGSINLGLEIAKNWLNADRYHWRQSLKYNYEVIAFNVFYPTHILNIVPFLRNNGIGTDKTRRVSPYIICGGQGVSNTVGCIDTIADEIFKGEIEGEKKSNGWHSIKRLNSDPIIEKHKAIIELTRGCKYKCNFCEYSWVQGNEYREKDIGLVKKQINDIKSKTNNINFLSANLGGYSQIQELLRLCQESNIRILNTDVCLKDIEHIRPIIKSKQAIKIGIESFSENTRKYANKPSSDQRLEKAYIFLMQYVSNIHSCMIYGLPHEDYSKWFLWLKKLAAIRKEQTKIVSTLFGPIRKKTHNIRLEFNITNFEPCIGTPFENESMVDFKEKDYFLKAWAHALKSYGFSSSDKPLTYKNAKGHFGKKEESYKLLMRLKRSGKEITPAIINAFPRGVGRTFKDDEALRFLEYCDGTMQDEQRLKKGQLLSLKKERNLNQMTLFNS